MNLDRIAPERLPELYRDAVAAKDEAAFLSMYAEDAVIFDAWEKWVYKGRSAWATVIRDWFASLGTNTTDVSFTEIDLSTSGSLGVLRAFITYSTRDAASGKLKSMENRLTWVLRQTSDGWMVAHEHTSAPADFLSGKVILKRNAT
jgi:uncharacterized protein (TIGR02246 family)